MREASALLGCALAAGLIVPVPGRCQGDPPRPADGPTHALVVGGGITDYHVRDDYLSPDAFRGSLLTADAAYRRESPKSWQAFELSFATGAINSTTQPRDVRQYVGSISYAYLRTLRSADGGGLPLAFSAGLGLSSFVTWTNFNATDPASGYTFYDCSWYWSHALDVHLLADYRFAGRRGLSVRLTSPLVRLLSRPDNAHYFNDRTAHAIRSFIGAASGGRLVAWWESPVLEWQLEYRQPIGPRVDLKIGYAFQTASYDSPLPMHMYTNRVTASLMWLRGASLR